MNIIAFKTIREFFEEHPIFEQPLRTWYTILNQQIWKKSQDAVETFGTSNVDLLRNDRLCIDVKGKHIRIILRVNYQSNTCFIRWIGWHKDYKKLRNKVHSILLFNYELDNTLK